MIGAKGSTALLVLGVLVPLVLSAFLWPSGGRQLDGGSRPARVSASGGVLRRTRHRTRLRTRRRTRLRPRRRGHDPAHEEPLAELVSSLAAPLRSGVPPSVALSATAAALEDGSPLGSLVHDLSAAASRGAPLAEVWQAHAATSGSPDLSFVARAWALSEQTGAPLAEALNCAEQVLLARVRARERLASAAAGPKASMAVLCLLPASGPVVGLVLGVDPRALYFSSPVGVGSLVIGATLGAGAWAWSRRILRGAT